MATDGGCRPMPRSRCCGLPGWWGCSPPRRPTGRLGHAGQALQRVLLVASSYNAAAALHSQPLEIPLLRDSIRIHLSGHVYPQMVLRLGATSEKAVSVRRPVDEVLF